MKTVSMVLLLAVSCAHRIEVWHEPVWPDTQSTIESVRCAVAQVYGEAVAVDVTGLPINVREGMAYAGEFDPRTRSYNLADSRTLLSSAYRHEVFQHAVPFFLTGDPNANHKQAWIDIAQHLDILAGQCRVKARGTAK